MSNNKYTVRFHQPVTLFGKELTNINPVNNPAIGVKITDSGWIEIRLDNRVALLPPSTIETIHYLETRLEALPKTGN